MPKKRYTYKKKVKRPVRATQKILNKFTDIFNLKGRDISMKDKSQIAKYIFNLNTVHPRRKRIYTAKNRGQQEKNLLSSIVASLAKSTVSDTAAMDKIRRADQTKTAEQNAVQQPPAIVREVPPHIPAVAGPLIMSADAPPERDRIKRINKIIPPDVIVKHAPDLLAKQLQEMEYREPAEEPAKEPVKELDESIRKKMGTLSEDERKIKKENDEKERKKIKKENDEKEALIYNADMAAMGINKIAATHPNLIPEKIKGYLSDNLGKQLREKKAINEVEKITEELEKIEGEITEKQIVEMKNRDKETKKKIEDIQKLNTEDAIERALNEGLLKFSDNNNDWYYKNKKGKRVYIAALKNPKRLKRILIKNIDKEDSSSSSEEEKKEGKGKQGKGLWNDEIDEIMKDDKNYIGAFGTEDIPELLKLIKEEKPKKFSFILNPGEHWVACNCDGLSLEFYDPLCEWEPTLEFYKDFKKTLEYFPHMLKFKINNVKQQSDSTANCGYFSCRFLKERANDVSFKQATDYPKTIKENEEDIKKFKRRQGFGYI